MKTSYRRMDDSQEVKSLKSSTLVWVLTQESYIEFISHITGSYLYLWSVFFATAISFFLCNLRKGLKWLYSPFWASWSFLSQKVHCTSCLWMEYIIHTNSYTNIMFSITIKIFISHITSLGVCVCVCVHNTFATAYLLMDF